jgi:hypothetical protein
MSKWLISISECGKDWNKHITYIMMDFLSGTDVFTSNKKSTLEYVTQCLKTFTANDALEFTTIKKELNTVTGYIWTDYLLKKQKCKLHNVLFVAHLQRQFPNM